MLSHLQPQSLERLILRDIHGLGIHEYASATLALVRLGHTLSIEYWLEIIRVGGSTGNSIAPKMQKELALLPLFFQSL